MRIRSIKYFEKKLAENKDMKSSCLPRNKIEECHFQIAEFFTKIKK